MEIEDWIDVGVLSTGRRLFALEQTRAAALALGGNDDVVARIGEATASDQQTRELEQLWGGARSKNVDAAVVGPLDARVDKTITAVRNGAEAQRQGAAPDDPIHETVDDLLRQAMPEGVYAITSRPYVEQLSETESLLGKLRGPLAGHVTELGLGRQVDRLAELVPLYRAALQDTGQAAITFEPVREARERGQRFLVEIVALVLGRYNRTDDAEHRAARAQLLTPLWKQVQAARALRGRRSGNGTEPDAGTPEPAADKPAAQPGEAQAAQPGEALAEQHAV